MRTLMMAVLLACAGASTGHAQKIPDSDVGSKIMAPENLWSQASAIKDLKSLGAILDDALLYVDPDGRVMTKPELVADVRKSPALQFITESMAVFVHGDTAIITGTYRLKGLEPGKPFVRRGRFVDTWRYKDGLWLAVASLATPIGN
jgi:ketosteroid isomerase-like protein